MFGPYLAFKEPDVLDEKVHKDLVIFQPKDFSFMKEVETVPVGFSEILPLTMYYPILIGKFQENFFPFIIMGVKKKNVYIDEQGNFKVPEIPKVCKVYPFFIIKETSPKEADWIVILDKSWAKKDIEDVEDGQRLFDELGEPTAFFQQIKENLTELARDFQKALDFCNELVSLKILKPINLEVACKYGRAMLKNIYIPDVEILRTISPERLFYLNSNGYFPLLYGMYFSARNFKLFDIL